MEHSADSQSFSQPRHSLPQPRSSLQRKCLLLFFNFFLFYLLTLQYCIGLPYINMNPPQVYTCSPS